MAGREKVYLRIKVQTKARMPGVEKLGPQEFKVRVASLPVKGAANQEIIKQLAAYFHLPSSKVDIVRGHRSKEKLIVLNFG